MKNLGLILFALAVLVAATEICDCLDRSTAAVKAANACQPVLASLLNE